MKRRRSARKPRATLLERTPWLRVDHAECVYKCDRCGRRFVFGQGPETKRTVADFLKIMCGTSKTVAESHARCEEQAVS